MIETFAQTYAGLLAEIVGQLSGLAVNEGQVLGATFVLVVDVECTALAASAIVAGVAILLTPGSMRERLYTGILLGVTLQGSNLVRLLAITKTGELLGNEALVWTHDWIAPVWMALVVATAWTLSWMRLSNTRTRALGNPLKSR